MTILIAFQRVKLSECPTRNVREFLELLKSSSHAHSVHQVSSESVHNFLRNRAIHLFWPDLSMVKNQLKKTIISGSESSPKSNQFIVTHRTCPPSFVRICPRCFEISCTQRQTNRQTEIGENLTSFHLQWQR